MSLKNKLTQEESRSVNWLNLLLCEWGMNAEEGARLLGILPAHAHERFRPLVGRQRAPTPSEQERISLAAKIFQYINLEFSRRRKFHMRNWLAKTRFPDSDWTIWEMLQSGLLSDLYLLEGRLAEILSKDLAGQA